MLNMYKNNWINIVIIVASIMLFVGALWLVRSQDTVYDVAYMKAMIPHHSIAILTSRRAHIRDPRVRKLADQIIQVAGQGDRGNEAIDRRPRSKSSSHPTCPTHRERCSGSQTNELYSNQSPRGRLPASRMSRPMGVITTKKRDSITSGFTTFCKARPNQNSIRLSGERRRGHGSQRETAKDRCCHPPK